MRLKIITLAAATALLGGCLSLSPKLPESLLTLQAENAAPAGAVTTGSEANALAVIEPEVSQRLNVTRVPVQVSDSEVAYLKDALWVEKPARLFRRLVAETIRARGGRLVVDHNDPAIVAGTRLRGSLREFGYDARTGSVVVRYDAVIDGGGDLRTRRFESRVDGVLAEAVPVGDALNRAANDVARQVADWVGGG